MEKMSGISFGELDDDLNMEEWSFALQDSCCRSGVGRCGIGLDRCCTVDVDFTVRPAGSVESVLRTLTTSRERKGVDRGPDLIVLIVL